MSEDDRRYPPPQFAPAAEASSEPSEEEAADEPAAPASEAIAAPAVAVSSVIAADASVAEDKSGTALAPVADANAELRAAVGASPPARTRRAPPPLEFDDDARPRRRTGMLALGAFAVAAVGITALVILGRINAARYEIRCGAKEVSAARGRAFPPWGTSQLDGEAWRPVAIPASVQCIAVETEDVAALGDAFRKVLVDRADALLTEREVTQIDPAAAMLEQALLHARSDSAPHKTARQEIQRMLGDVGYWRASAKLRAAATTLTEAAAEFEAASAQLPRHVADANAWAIYIRKVVDELRAGPAGAKQSPFPPSTEAAKRPAAPPGTELPVEPSAGSGSAAPAPPTAPDAGVPSGGVLL